MEPPGHTAFCHALQRVVTVRRNLDRDAQGDREAGLGTVTVRSDWRLRMPLSERKLFQRQIVRGPHAAVRAGAADFHLSARELMKEVGSSPVVHEFTALVDTHAIVRLQESDLSRVRTVQGTGDFGIVSHRIFMETQLVLTKHGAHVLQNRGGW